MSTAKALDKEINMYLVQLNARQKEAVLSVMKTFARDEAWWNDKEYLAEMGRRFTGMETGKIKSLTLEEIEAQARQSYKPGKRKRR